MQQAAALNKYKTAQREFFRFRNTKQYAQARKSLQQMIDIAQDNPSLFTDPLDLVRIQRSRLVMLSYNEERLHAGLRLAELLRESARWSTPSVCQDQPCFQIDPHVCKSRRDALTPLQARMCIEKINQICHALKIEAAIAAQGSNYEESLHLRRQAVEYHGTLMEFASNRQRTQNQHYLQYWRCINEGVVKLMDGEFHQAKQWFQNARDEARFLNYRRCFPNYFRTPEEISSYEYFIGGIEKVHASDFALAQVDFGSGWTLACILRMRTDFGTTIFLL